MTQRSIVRIERSRGGLERLGAEVQAWLQRRVAADAAGQYRTQLTTLHGVLDQALRGLGSRLDGVADSDAVGSVYESCGEIDGAAAWVRRVWEYYRERFDQRDDPRWAAMLRAADEVVWSCYAEPMRIAGGVGPAGAIGAAPLPFVDEVIAPEAALRQEPPRSLKLPRGVAPAVQDEMDAFLRSLPIPTVALPPDCAAEPWWLSVLGHEVGHTVLADLSAQAEGEFGEGLAAAALEVSPDGSGPEAADRWRRWAHEVFADAFFVLVMGRAGVTAVEEFETASPEAMAERRVRYPPARARIEFVRHLAQGSGAAASVEIDDAVARRVAAGVAEIPVTGAAGPTRLEDLTRSTGPELETHLRSWVDGLRGRGVLVPRRESRAARRLAGAGLLAWEEVAGLPDAAQRAEARGGLAEALLDSLPRCREDGVRAAGQAPPSKTAELGSRLAGLGLQHGGRDAGGAGEGGA
jgi:hypothetical protein